MTCPDVEVDLVPTRGGAHSVPVVHPSSELLGSDWFMGTYYIAVGEENKAWHKSGATVEYIYSPRGAVDYT